MGMDFKRLFIKLLPIIFTSLIIISPPSPNWGKVGIGVTIFEVVPVQIQLHPLILYSIKDS